MIFDQVDSAGMYGGLGERIAAGLALLSDERVLNAPLGKHEVQGQDLYFILMEYTTKRPVEALPEIHRKYMDIQCVLSGQEYIGYAPLEGLTLETPYDGQKDVALYAVQPQQTLLRMTPGMFAIFWPNEPHAPCICVDTPAPVKKIVVKVKME